MKTYDIEVFEIGTVPGTHDAWKFIQRFINTLAVSRFMFNVFVRRFSLIIPLVWFVTPPLSDNSDVDERATIIDLPNRFANIEIGLSVFVVRQVLLHDRKYFPKTINTGKADDRESLSASWEWPFHGLVVDFYGDRTRDFLLFRRFTAPKTKRKQ